jgi:hypothetical protein
MKTRRSELRAMELARKQAEREAKAAEEQSATGQKKSNSRLR